MGRHLTEKEKVKISELHSKGCSYEEIREKLGRKVSDTSIIRYKDYSGSTSKEVDVSKGRSQEKKQESDEQLEGEQKPSRSPSGEVAGQQVESAFIEEKDTRTQKQKPKKQKEKEVIKKDGRAYYLIKSAETSKIDDWEKKKKILLDRGYKYLAITDGKIEVFKEDEI